MEIETPRGLARAETIKPKGKVSSWLLLGHGAGGDVGSADLTAVTEAAVAAGVAVALVTQPYRVAGRKAPAPAAQLDEAWLAVVAELRRTAKIKVPLIVGGRSSGARVACRTARDSGAAGVVALAFPLHPPGRPEKTRDDELATGVPTLVVNGDRDPFGVPDARAGLDLVVLPGERHDLRKDPSAVAAAVVGWLRSHDWAR
ncbi:MAG: alpha/beta hydrolase [Hamadaea sp.]|uniref:alpha/beta hydrolase family protein n=1 Tax=Hamadaea sp. TaxID=2024425 RepID=UPI0017BEE23D|nr:alpha/beta family hydrolase [Hamadaea sp.]NUR69869.1 alpha/beta hydrolase [Hamadaea sp.]NUT22065.1 alpha/beta hydrolase [Hamadaea sp.]